MENSINSGDTAFARRSHWSLTPGVAFFYGGLVRGKNVLNTMMMSVISMGLVALAVGYSPLERHKAGQARWSTLVLSDYSGRAWAQKYHRWYLFCFRYSLITPDETGMIVDA